MTTEPAPPASTVVLTVEPGIGIGAARLGMSRAEVHDALAPLPGALEGHHSRDAFDYFFANALQVEYDVDGASQLLVASASPLYSLSLRGRDPFDSPARELFEELARLDGGAHVFEPDDHAFPNVGVSLGGAAERYDAAGEVGLVYGQVVVGLVRRDAAPRSTQGARAPLWQPPRKKRMSRLEVGLTVGLLVIALGTLGFHALDSPWLAGAATTMPVTIVAVQNSAPSEGRLQLRITYEVRLPDGTHARLSSGSMHAPGTRLTAMVARSRITGRAVVGPPYVVLPDPE
jgi:hypothetical protein